MKYLFLFFLFSLSFLTISAQDTIVRRNGEQVVAKVLEVNTTEVRYKRADAPDGPVYAAAKWELQYIIYAGGRKESYLEFNPPPPLLARPVDLSIQISGSSYYYKEHRISERDMLNVAQQRKDKKVDLMIRETRDKRLIQTAFFAGGLCFFTSGLYVYATNLPRRRGRRGAPVSTASSATARQNAGYLLLGGVACEAVAVVFKIDRVRHAHMVTTLYNQSLLQ
ncbi:MAG TPA: hypothetical protein VGO45_05240 [Bacteroidia bacterium]|jgi:hypothetical protein|nr:hypothetical protein [Bacteroidia bacterium]